MHLQSAPLHPAQRRRAAIAIATTTLIALAALTHHPVVDHHSSHQNLLAQLAALQWMDGMVHGALIAMLAVLAIGHAIFGRMLGVRRAPVLIAMTAYGIGCCNVVAAMLLDGFAVPQLARQFVHAAQAEIDVVRVVLGAIGTLIQVLTKAGLLAMCASLLAWAYALATGPWPRWCAAVGLAAGLGPALFISLAEVRLAPASLTAIFAVHAAWNLAAASLLWRQRTS